MIQQTKWKNRTRKTETNDIDTSISHSWAGREGKDSLDARDEGGTCKGCSMPHAEPIYQNISANIMPNFYEKLNENMKSKKEKMRELCT